MVFFVLISVQGNVSTFLSIISMHTLQVQQRFLHIFTQKADLPQSHKPELNGYRLGLIVSM